MSPSPNRDYSWRYTLYRYPGKVHSTQECIGLLLRGVETATGFLQLLLAIAFSGSRHSPMKCSDLGGPSLNKHRGVSSRNGSISKFSNSYRLRSWMFSFLLKAVLGKVVASKKTGRWGVVAFENLCKMRMTSV